MVRSEIFVPFSVDWLYLSSCLLDKRPLMGHRKTVETSLILLVALNKDFNLILFPEVAMLAKAPDKCRQLCECNFSTKMVR